MILIRLLVLYRESYVFKTFKWEIPELPIIIEHVMTKLNIVDFSVILGYIAALIGLGFYLRKRASNSLEDYFLGGRKMPWWALGISGMASCLDVSNTSLIVAFLFMLGPRGLYAQIRGNVAIVFIFMLLWGGKWHRRSRCMTSAEWMKFRFGEDTGAQFARISAALTAVLWTSGMIALMVKGIGSFYSMFIPNFTPTQCAIFMVCLATFYTILSGFYGVVFTDIFQSVIIASVVLGLSILAFCKITDVQVFNSLAESVSTNSNWSTAGFTWRANMPDGYKQYEALGLFVLFFIMHNFIGGLGSGSDTKFYAARNDRECGTLSFLWITMLSFRWPMAMAFAVMGIILVGGTFTDQSALVEASELIKYHVGDIDKAQWNDTLSLIINNAGKYPSGLTVSLQRLLGEGWQEKIFLLSYEGNVNPERILPAVIIEYIPLGLRGLVIIALVAASMSTFDTYLNSCSGNVVRDLYQRYMRPKASNKELIYASYVTGGILVLLGFGLASTTESINDIWGWIVMGLGAGGLAPGVLRMMWWRFSGAGYAFGSIIGMSCAIAQRLLRPVIVETWPQLSFMNDERWSFCILASISFLVCIIATLLTKPTDSEVTRNFYFKTKPFGLWGPLKKMLPADQRKAMVTEHLFDIATVPFAFFWMLSMYMLPMLLVIHNYSDFWKTLVIFIVSLIGMYFLWYRKLPKSSDIT